MITRFYVDNYKCLQNFEYKPEQLELIVGANGVGKTTVFEALDKVRRFVTGEADARELFDSKCATRWGSRPQQVFELDYNTDGIAEQYRLEINLSSDNRVEKETLKIGRGATLFWETSWEPRKRAKPDPIAVALGGTRPPPEDHRGEVRVLKWSEPEDEDDSIRLANSNQSAFSLFPSVVEEAVTQTHFFKINPAIMTSQVGKVEPRPANDLSNFASYYLYLLQQKQGRMFDMIPHLREAIVEFDSFAVEEDFEAARRDLRVLFRQASAKNGSAPLRYGFEELSDGQRALIVLYTLLFCTLEKGSTLIIDEPENYIALRELQPWLMLLRERLEEHGGQVILISHHPEFINALAPSHTTVFERENGGPVRIKPFGSKLAGSLAPSEIMARGWENE